ncbi:MAG: hypothetical protein LQ338_008168, partial [Usnochroma carphineum]
MCVSSIPPPRPPKRARAVQMQAQVSIHGLTASADRKLPENLDGYLDELGFIIKENSPEACRDLITSQSLLLRESKAQAAREKGHDRLDTAVKNTETITAQN